MPKFIAALAVMLLGATAAEAASFDCDKASAADEKTICENRSLNDADVRMSTMFDLAVNMVAMGERDSLRSAQTKWLETRTACNADTACLKGAYDQRIADLQKTFEDFELRAAE